MKQILTLLFILITLICSAQNYRFEPKWKKGDTYQANIVTTTKSFENGVADLDDVQTMDPIFKIAKKESDHFSMVVTFKDVIQSNLLKISEKYNITVEPANLELKYSISRVDGSYELINFNEAKSFMNDSFEEMKRVIVEKSGDIEAGNLYDDLMFPLRLMFSDEDLLSQYFGQTLEMMLMPFYKDLSLNEPFLEVEREANPFKPGDSLVTKSYIILESFSENENIARIKSETEVDLESFKEMMKTMMGQFAEIAVKSDTSLTETEITDGLKEKQAEMDMIEMEMASNNFIVINTTTGWPVEFTQETNILMKMGVIKNSDTKSITSASYKKL